MAHNLEFRNGKYSFVENGKKERAWHELGKVFDGELTTIEALTESGANFNVEKRNLYFPTKDIEEIIASGRDISASELRDLFKVVENRKGNIRTDANECLGVVSDAYGIVQNADAFSFIDTLCSGKCDGATPIIESAGVLGNGERIFITAKFPEQIKLDNKGEDLVEMYVVFTTSHDGTGAVQCMVTPVRVVCNNTLNYAMSHNSGKLSLRHTVNVNNRLDLTNKENAVMAYKALSLYNVYRNSFEQSLLELAQIKVTDKQAEQILVNSLLPADAVKIYNENDFSLNSEDISTRSKNIIANVTESLHTGVGQNILAENSGLWLVNGLTTYYQNEARFKDDETKMQSILDGLVNKKLQSVYDGLLAIA